MSWDRDRFEAIRRYFESLPDVEAPDPDSPRGRVIYAAVLARHRRRTARRRRVRRLVLVFGTLLVLAGTAYALLRPPADSLAVTCFADADLDADRYGAVLDPDDDAMAVCAQAWERGDLTHPEVARGEVPPLVSCISETESRWVFPASSSDFCATLGLPEAGPPLEGDPVLELSSRLESYAESEGCITMEQAEVQVREILDDLGLDEWAVTVQPPVAGRPCASFGVDPQNSRILVIPAPEPTDR